MNNKASIELGKKIKSFRKKRGITQEELAELTETSYKYIQRIEGKTPPDIRLSTIVRLAKALKIKPAELLMLLVGQNNMQKNHHVLSYRNSPIEFPMPNKSSYIFFV